MPASPALAIGALAFLSAAPALAQSQPMRIKTEKGEVLVETVARGLENPWGLAFLPDGRMLVTERPGRLRIVSAGRRALAPARRACRASGARPGRAPRRRARSGLCREPHDLSQLCGSARRGRCRHQRRARPPQHGRHRPRRAAGDLPAGALLQRLEPLGLAPRLRPHGRALRHPRRPLRPARRGPESGKPHRQGRSASGRRAARPRAIRSKAPAGRRKIWSIGHRNIQGAALHPQTGELWTAEHGARGGDEINIPRKGLNYGWPVITYGVDYSGAKIGDGTRKAGHGAAGLLLGPLDRALRHGLLHRRQVPGLARQRARRRARRPDRLASRARRRQGRARGAHAERSCASASATSARAPTASSTSSPIPPTAASCACARRMGGASSA